MNCFHLIRAALLICRHVLQQELLSAMLRNRIPAFYALVVLCVPELAITKALANQDQQAAAGRFRAPSAEAGM